MAIAKNNFGKQQPELDIPEGKGFVRLVRVEHRDSSFAEELCSTIVTYLKFSLYKELRTILNEAYDTTVFFRFTDNSVLTYVNGIPEYEPE